MAKLPYTTRRKKPTWAPRLPANAVVYTVDTGRICGAVWHTRGYHTVTGACPGLKWMKGRHISEILARWGAKRI